LVASLGCLFTSFASQFHQLFISYGVFIGKTPKLLCSVLIFGNISSAFKKCYFNYCFLTVGVGVGLTRDASSLMVGQYFKRKRDLVEIIVVSGSGLGILVMSVSIHTAIRSVPNLRHYSQWELERKRAVIDNLSKMESLNGPNGGMGSIKKRILVGSRKSLVSLQTIKWALKGLSFILKELCLSSSVKDFGKEFV